MSLMIKGLFQIKRREEGGKTPDSRLFLDISCFFFFFPHGCESREWVGGGNNQLFWMPRA